MEIKINNQKIPKLTLQINVFVYSKLIYFPVTDFQFKLYEKCRNCT